MSRTTPIRARGWRIVAIASAALIVAPGFALAGQTSAHAGQAPAHPSSDLVNAGFENGLTGWTVTGPAGAAKIEGQGHDSASRLTHWLEASGTVTTAQTVTGLAEGWWTMRAWVTSGGDVDSSHIALKGCGVDGATTVPNTETDGAWLQLTVTAYVSRGSCTVQLVTSGAAGSWASLDDVSLTPGAVDRTIRGADLSSVPKNQDKGALYKTSNGATIDPVKAFADAGANVVRLKAWVNPPDGYNDTAHVVAMAKRAKAAGMRVLIDFHYSDTWTDPGKQTVPTAWKGMSASQMTRALYDYTHGVMVALRTAGITPYAAQIGNEINPGMLWPLGQTWDVDPSDGVADPQWDNLAAFLTAGHDAVKAVSPSTQTILHLTNINNGIDGLTWWFDEITARHVPFDLIGLSYYGYWHGTLADLQNAVTTLSERYDKDVLVVETAYPFTLADNPNPAWENSIDQESELVKGYPATPAGQAANFRAVQDVVAAAPGGRGIGAVYWEPAWTDVAGNGWDPADPSSGNAWENQAMFDYSDRALPAMADYAADPVAVSTLAPASAALNLGTVRHGSSSDADVVLRNTGTASFTGRVQVTASGPFAFSESRARGTITLAPGASAKIGSVTFASRASGAAHGALAITATSTAPAQQRVAAFSGTLRVALSAGGHGPGHGTGPGSGSTVGGHGSGHGSGHGDHRGGCAHAV